MARIRTIKPEFWDDEKLGRNGALVRLTFMGMISQADDDGRGRGRPEYLKARLHAYDETTTVPDVIDALRRIERLGLAVFYETAGDLYYFVPNFPKHQKVDRRTPSRLPAPPNTRSSKVFGGLDEPSPTPRRVLGESSSREGIVEGILDLDLDQGREGSPREGKPTSDMKSDVSEPLPGEETRGAHERAEETGKTGTGTPGAGATVEPLLVAVSGPGGSPASMEGTEARREPEKPHFDLTTETGRRAKVDYLKEQVAKATSAAR